MDTSPIVIPPSEEHTHTIIFLHGRGDTARAISTTLFWDRTSSGQTLREVFPSVRWVFPQARIRDCARTGDRMSQWFDLWDPQNLSEREELQLHGLRESVEALRELVYEEARLVGGSDKVVLAGISQGGATAVHTLLHLEFANPETEAQADGERLTIKSAPTRLAAFLGFSCRLPFPGRSLHQTREVLAFGDSPQDDILRNTPVLLEHCADDPLVRVSLGRQLRDALEGFGMQGVWKEYPKGGHWFNSPHGTDDVVAFLKAQGLKASQ